MYSKRVFVERRTNHRIICFMVSVDEFDKEETSELRKIALSDLVIDATSCIIRKDRGIIDLETIWRGISEWY